MIIKTNRSAINTHNKLKANAKDTAKAAERLSSGLRLNRASDDAAGLAISAKMRGQIRGLDQAGRNIQDGISMIQTAEGGLGETHSILQRMRELSVQMSNDTYTDADRMATEKEFGSLKEEINRISENTKFNGISVLNKGASASAITAVSETEIAVTVGPGATVVAGYIEVTDALRAARGTLTISGAFGTISGSEWPDLNIKSPNGEEFGYGEAINGANGYCENTTNTSSTKATYTGWGSGTEQMTFENPINGKWYIEIRNTGGTLESTFSITSNYPLTVNTLGAGAVPNVLSPVHIQGGANAGEGLDFPLVNAGCSTLNLDRAIINTRQNAADSIGFIDSAINTVSKYRAQFGAYQNRLEHMLANSDNYGENLQASESRITDADMAKEMMNMTKSNVLNQSATAMLAQANNLPQNILSLIR